MTACNVSLVLMLALPVAVASSRSTIVTDDAVSLLTVQTKVTKHANGRQPKPSNWFNGFAVGESTYEYGGRFENTNNDNPQIHVMDGWYPKVKNPYADSVKNEKWFQETKSGGEKQPWQTFYPQLNTGIAGDFPAGDWYRGSGGVWQEAYQSPADFEVGNLKASWFDDSVRQVDGFGREMLPTAGSPRNYIDWEEKSVNTSLTCKAAGCMANVSLLAPFDFNTEMVKDCKLDVFFHPTDFDDEFIGEHVEWVQVNGHTASTKCRPYSDGCNMTASRPLIPCVYDLPMDNLMTSNGAIAIAAKISGVVDECPHKGNLLSAVPMMTCLVAPKATGVHGAHMVKKVDKKVVDNMVCVTKMPLQCATKGCASLISLPMNDTCAGLGSCTLDINVQQTDYDNKDGTLEAIEYIKVYGKKVTKAALKPGQNPCKSTWHGKPIKAALETYAALKNHPVKVTAGHVLIEGKITKFVDECPTKEGYLLDAEAVVTCKKK